ncbi:MAG: hypothetical protein M3N57_10910 [Actinomycetota bacterium]|nr:hypothetical protein [Actinomycetota bacterium]
MGRVIGIRLVAAVASLVLAGVAPAAAHPAAQRQQATPSATGGNSHLDNPRQGLEEVGFHNLGNKGFNTDIWTHVTQDGTPDARLFAYTGTWGALTGNDPCPSQRDDPQDPQKSGVWVVEATDPANPMVVAKLPTVPGSQNNDVKVVEDVETSSSSGDIVFSGDILAHTLEPCGADLGVALIDAVNDIPRAQTGFQLWDVSDPTAPERLGSFNNGGSGTHNLFAFHRPDLGKAFVAAVHNDSDLVTGEDLVGTVQFVDISDPNAPQLVSQWALADAQTQGGPTFDQLCEPRGEHLASCNLHDVWVSDDGKIAYLSFWDAGLILLDVQDPTEPAFIGQIQPGGTDNEGNTHAAVPLMIGGRHLVVVGDEDFVGPGPAPFTVIASAPEGAAVRNGERFQGAEFTGTRPLTGEGTGPFPALASDDGFGCSYTQAATTGATLDGWIAVARRGGTLCPLFQEKVTIAETAGAAGLIVVNDQPEGTTSGLATGAIPAMMIAREPGERLLDSIGALGSDVTVIMQLQEPDEVNPWGFMRVVDATSPKPVDWKEVSTFKAPHVDTVAGQGPENVFSAHNPIVGPDGRVYFAWYTDGVRVLEPHGADGEFREVAWFVPLATDHDDDNDADPHSVQEANFGFWGSKAVIHPRTGELLVFNSDLNRGIYILRATDQGEGPDTTSDTKTAQQAQSASGSTTPVLPATGGGQAATGLLALGGALLAAGWRRAGRRSSPDDEA